ncbi:MAG: diphthine--ammonia ligase [Candidatus Hadarchaeales archaeon]
MRVSALCSGGKDSAYALWLAMKAGHEVIEILTVVPQREDSWMYHTANIWMIDMFGECAGLPLRKVGGGESREDELSGLIRALGETDAEAVVSGAIASRYQRSAIERACSETGLKPLFPIWGRDPSDVLREIVREGFEALITLVAAEGLGPEWLGRRIDMRCVEELERISRKFGINVSGEGGEYESLVTDAPFFRKRIEVEDAERIWNSAGGRGLFSIKRAKVVNKQG